MGDRRLLEICCDSLESARAAAQGGADRIELCVDLPADGLTPPIALLDQLKAEEAIPIPVFALVRCRAGDFCFSAAEVETMCGEIVALREAGVDGIVCGALDRGGRIDRSATESFIAAASGLPFTFHKGFDACVDLEAAMRELVKLGVDRVLTSAGERRAIDAEETLVRLAEIGFGVTRILCGGGIRSANLGELVDSPGLHEFHSAARSSADRPVELKEVRAMVRILSG